MSAAATPWTIEAVDALLREWGVEAGLRVEELWEEVHDGDRFVMAIFVNERIGLDEPQGLFFNATFEPGSDAETSETTSYLTIWLEEAFHTSAPWWCPRDADGLAWTSPYDEGLPPGRDPSPLQDREGRSTRVAVDSPWDRWSQRLRVGLGLLVGRYRLSLGDPDDELPRRPDDRG